MSTRGSALQVLLLLVTLAAALAGSYNSDRTAAVQLLSALGPLPALTRRLLGSRAADAIPKDAQATQVASCSYLRATAHAVSVQLKSWP